MSKQRHRNATTTPEMREFIRESDLPTAVLARLLNISETTVRKWRQRESIEDASHKPHNIKTSLSPAQEYVVVELRKRLLLSLDELLEVCQKFILPTLSRASLQRCLKRHGISQLNKLDDDGQLVDVDAAVKMRLQDKAQQKEITAAVEPESIKKVLGKQDIIRVAVSSLPQFDSDSPQSRLLIASVPETRWVYVDIFQGDEVAAAERYMSHVLTKAPFHIRRILAGNFNEFLSRYRVIENNDDGHQEVNHEE